MKIKFPNMKLRVSKLFCKLVLGFPYFPLSLPLSVAYPHAPALPSLSFWCLLMDFGCRAKFRSAWKCSRGQCRQHPMWNSPHRVPLPHQSPDPEQQCSPIALPGSSTSLPLEVEQQKWKASFTNFQVFYCYCTTQVTRWRDFFPCLKGVLLLTLHWLWHAITELETCSSSASGKQILLKLHFTVSLSQ